MKRRLKYILLWIYLKFHSIFVNISIILYNTEIEILKANPDDLNESNKKTTRMLHHNKLLEKFYAGQTDEKYVRDYYDLLKKADKFMREANTHQKTVAADKWGMKDNNGNIILDNIGFFDDKHKNAGKTMQEGLKFEMIARRTIDDDYELLGIINNKPIETGLSKIDDVVDDELNVNDLLNKSKSLEFPIKITRDSEVVNKIEQLAEYMHIKKIGFEHRQLEFFIPLKFGTANIKEDDEIFKQLTTIDLLYVYDAYGESTGFNVDRFKKRIIHNDTHEVWKFHGMEMETIKFI